MTFEHSCQRADILGTQIITRDTGKRLGVVNQLWVDIDRREVVAIGLRESMLSGVLSNTQELMLLSNVRQFGDVILVDDDSVIEETLNVEGYSSLINCEVVTEAGDLLGKVRGYKFNVNTGQVEALVIASFGMPLIPDQVISTYELSMDEVVSSGPDRLIVFEGAEEKMVQLTVGVLERLGIGRAPWDREDDYYVMPTSSSNQLGTGIPTAEPLRTAAPAAQERTWDEDAWNEAPQPLAEEAYAPAEASNWEDDDRYEYEPISYNEPPRQEMRQYAEPQYPQEPQYSPEPQPAPEPQYVEEDVTRDAWGEDENPQPYAPPKLNIPQREQVAEYEEETDY
jgi:sporulation protein YlmC with PRC-barrel domain